MLQKEKTLNDGKKYYTRATADIEIHSLNMQ